jgi:hypothetical protein
MKILFATNTEFWMIRRVEILYQGLKQNNVNIIECFSKKNFFKRFFKHFIKRNFDIILVHGAFPFLFAWLMKAVHRKKIIYDVFISRYNTEVEDRKRVKNLSLKAKMLFFLTSSA